MPRSTRIMTPAGLVDVRSHDQKPEPYTRNYFSETLYTEPETADILRVSRLTLRKWRINGTGPRYTKMGKQVLYRASEIERYIEERTSGNE